MKKIDIMLICLALGLVWGCKKKPAENPGSQLGTSKVSVTIPETPAVSEAASEVQAGAASAEVKPSLVEESNSAAKSVTANPDHLAWMTDFEAAKKKAVDEGKDLFINFTGSDWCGWCIRLDKEVFSQKLFFYEAQKRFVFVMIDFPKKKKISASLEKQNDQLARQYQVQGFPTIILATADGKTYAQTGYEEGGPMRYLEHLAELRMKKPAK